MQIKWRKERQRGKQRGKSLSIVLTTLLTLSPSLPLNATPNPEHRAQVSVSADYSTSELTGGGFRNNVDFDIKNGTIAITTQIDESVTLLWRAYGGSLEVESSRIINQHIDTDVFGGAFGVERTLTDGVKLRALVSYAHNESDLMRSTGSNMPNMQNTVTADYDSNELGIAIGLLSEYEFETWWARADVELFWQKFNQGSFRETGPGAGVIQSQRRRPIHLAAGAAIGRQYHWSEHVKVRLSGGFKGLWQLDNDRLNGSLSRHTNTVGYGFVANPTSTALSDFPEGRSLSYHAQVGWHWRGGFALIFQAQSLLNTDLDNSVYTLTLSRAFRRNGPA